MTFRKSVLLILLSCEAFAGLGNEPEEDDLFKAHYKRMMATAELVFVYESVDTNGSRTAGSAFLIEINNLTYIATNWHVFENVILQAGSAFRLTNQFGRKLLITSPYYYRLKQQDKPKRIPENIEEVMHDGIYSDLVLIPYTMQYFEMEAFKPADEPTVQTNQTAIVLGNTLGQGYINTKEGIINYVNKFCFGIISGARKGNSGGPVLNLNNEVIGMLTSGGGPQGVDGADQSVCIRMDKERLEFYVNTGQLEAKAFPNDIFIQYTQDIKANYKPEPHHSRDKGTPHLSIGLAGGGMGLSGGMEYSWEINRREQIHKPLKCYNWDIIPRERLEKLCVTYGQTVVEFIPDHWIEFYYSDTIYESSRKHKAIELRYSEALRSRRKMESYATRKAKMESAKKNKILGALRDMYNATQFVAGKKMRQSGEITEIEECINNLDAGL